MYQIGGLCDNHPLAALSLSDNQVVARRFYEPDLLTDRLLYCTKGQ
jgi:hypothetical protein